MAFKKSLGYGLDLVVVIYVHVGAKVKNKSRRICAGHYSSITVGGQLSYDETDGVITLPVSSTHCIIICS